MRLRLSPVSLLLPARYGAMVLLTLCLPRSHTVSATCALFLSYLGAEAQLFRQVAQI